VHRSSVACRTPLAGSSLGDVDAVALEQVLRAIADRQRLRILSMLVRADGAEICVCEFTAGLDVPQQNVSYHLKQLVEAGIISRARRGRYSFYALVPGALDHVATLVGGPRGQVAAA
jgi:ArsR family transcriptional regulator